MKKNFIKVLRLKLFNLILFLSDIIFRFYILLISEIGVALILNCIIIPLAARDTPMPYIVKKIFLQYIAYYTFCRRPDDASISKISNSNNHKSSSKNQENKLYNNGFMNSTFNDNIIFANNKHITNNTNRLESSIMNGAMGLGGYHNLMGNGNPVLPSREKIDNVAHLRDRRRSLKASGADSGDNPLYDMTDTLNAIHELMLDEMNTRKYNEDWVQLTLVLDRVFFLVFVITIFVSVGVVIGEAPKITM